MMVSNDNRWECDGWLEIIAVLMGERSRLMLLLQPAAIVSY